MMQWLVAYSANYTAAQTDTDMPALSDVTLTLDTANHPLLPIQLFGMWFYGLGNTLSRVRISTPKFRGISRPLIRPIEQAANPSSRPIFMEAWRHKLLFNAVEPVAVLVSNNAPTGGERNFALISFGDGNLNAPQGDQYTIRLTSAFTATANAWTASGQLTFDDVLMAGRYSIIGFDTFGAGGVAARLVFPGPCLPGALPQVRPGIIMNTGNGAQATRYFRYGYLGEFGQFESFAPPQMEVLMTAGTTNPELYWDIVQTRVGAMGAR